MIDRYNWQPANRIMAILADISRLYVRWILALCVSSVVATRTITGDIHMIEVGGGPA